LGEPRIARFRCARRPRRRKMLRLEGLQAAGWLRIQTAFAERELIVEPRSVFSPESTGKGGKWTSEPSGALNGDGRRGSGPAVQPFVSLCGCVEIRQLKAGRQMTRRTGSSILASALKKNGVQLIFHVPGESFMSVIDSLSTDHEDIQLITCRHEGSMAV